MPLNGVRDSVLSVRLTSYITSGEKDPLLEKQNKSDSTKVESAIKE